MYKRQGLLGSNDKVDPDDYSPLSEASNFFSSATSTVTVAAVGMGSLGNGINVTLSYIGPSGTASVTLCSPVVTIAVYSDSTATEVASLINSCSSTSGLVASAVDNADFSITANNTITLGSGTDTLTMTRRYDGQFNRIKHMLIGPLGALLFKNGITTGALLCSSSGSYSTQVDGDSVVLTLGVPTSNAVHPNFSANNSYVFEKKLLLTINGVAEQAYYFNCNDTSGNDDLGVGAYVSYENDSGRSMTQQVFWDVTTPGAEVLESNVKFTENGYSYWLYNIFKKNSALDLWNFWSVQGSDEFNSYVRATAKTPSSNIYEYSQDVGSASDLTTTFTVASSDQEWAISNALKQAPGFSTNQEPGTAVNASFTNPNTALDFSVNEIVNNASFWPLSY